MTREETRKNEEKKKRKIEERHISWVRNDP